MFFGGLLFPTDSVFFAVNFFCSTKIRGLSRLKLKEIRHVHGIFRLLVNVRPTQTPLYRWVKGTRQLAWFQIKKQFRREISGSSITGQHKTKHLLLKLAFFLLKDSSNSRFFLFSPILIKRARGLVIRVYQYINWKHGTLIIAGSTQRRPSRICFVVSAPCRISRRVRR